MPGLSVASGSRACCAVTLRGHSDGVARLLTGRSPWLGPWLSPAQLEAKAPEVSHGSDSASSWEAEGH